MIRRIALLLVLVGGCPSTLRAALPCRSLYDEMPHMLREANLEANLAVRIETKVQRAWHAYSFERESGPKNAVSRLAPAISLLRANPVTRIPEQPDLLKKLTSFRDCLAEAAPVPTGTLDVLVVMPDGITPAPEARVRLDGKTLGMTGPNGRVSVVVPVGTIEFDAVIYASFVGPGVATVKEGQRANALVILGDRSEVAHEWTPLFVVEAPDGVLPQTFTTFTVRFESDESFVPMKGFDQILFQNINVGDQDGTVVNDHFQMSNGTIVLRDLASFKALLVQEGAYKIEVAGWDVHGVDHQGEALFVVGRHTLTFDLVVPSNPSVPVANLEVTAEFGEKMARTVRSDAKGRGRFTLLPSGGVSLRTEVETTDSQYLGWGMTYLDGDAHIRVPLLTFEELKAP